jgi:hypothetical protein
MESGAPSAGAAGGRARWRPRSSRGKGRWRRAPAQEHGRGLEQATHRSRSRSRRRRTSPKQSRLGERDVPRHEHHSPKPPWNRSRSRSRSRRDRRRSPSALAAETATEAEVNGAAASKPDQASLEELSEVEKIKRRAERFGLPRDDREEQTRRASGTAATTPGSCDHDRQGHNARNRARRCRSRSRERNRDSVGEIAPPPLPHTTIGPEDNTKGGRLVQIYC